MSRDVIKVIFIIFHQINFCVKRCNKRNIYCIYQINICAVVLKRTLHKIITEESSSDVG